MHFLLSECPMDGCEICDSGVESCDMCQDDSKNCKEPDGQDSSGLDSVILIIIGRKWSYFP